MKMNKKFMVVIVGLLALVLGACSSQETKSTTKESSGGAN
jgi:L-cystine transport system substrate-binding protein